MSPRTLAQPRTNLVTNPSVEQGNINFTGFTIVDVGGAAVDGTHIARGGSGSHFTDEFIPIDPAHAYTLEGWLRWSAGATQPRSYFGLIPYDASKVTIAHVEVYGDLATETTLAADVNPADTTISLTSAAGWSSGTNNYVCFRILDNGADMPNRNVLTARSILSIATNVLTMTGPVGVTWPAGTRVRMHHSGGTFMYSAAINVLTPATFTKYTGIITGQQAPYSAPSSNNWWIGTRFVKLLWLLDHPSFPGSTTDVDACSLYSDISAAELEQSEFVHLLEFQFASGTVRFSTGSQDLLWDSQSWEAVGGLLEIGGVEETSDARAQGIDVRLSGVDQAILSVLLNSHYRGRTVKLWRAHLDQTTGLVIGTPLLLFQGLQLSPYTVEEEQSRAGGTVKISTRLSGYFGVERVRGIVSNLVSHQHHFNGETFFQHSASLANTKIYWGTPVPLTIGSNYPTNPYPGPYGPGH